MADNHNKSEVNGLLKDAEDMADAMHQVEVHNEKDTGAVHDELVRSKGGGYIPLASGEKHQSRALNLKFDLFVLPFSVLIYFVERSGSVESRKCSDWWLHERSRDSC